MKALPIVLIINPACGLKRRGQRLLVQEPIVVMPTQGLMYKASI
jgi:hypothetical protein